MTTPQEQFSEFIAARLKDGEDRPAKALLAEAFENLKNNAIAPEYWAAFRTRLSPMIKADSLSEVLRTVQEFTSANI